MSKSDRLIKIELQGGGRAASIVSLGAICKIVPGQVPDGYIQNEGLTKHFVCTDFTFKAKCRQRLSDTEKDEEGNPLPVEQEMLRWTIDWALTQNASISFGGNAKPSRMDQQFRLEERGFIRDKKTKVITYGLTKL
jgi:hypothetical protein